MVVLSNLGHIVDQQWQLLRQLKTYIYTPVWVVMPNHFHGILIINENQGIPEDEAFPQTDPVVDINSDTTASNEMINGGGNAPSLQNALS